MIAVHASIESEHLRCSLILLGRHGHPSPVSSHCRTASPSAPLSCSMPKAGSYREPPGRCVRAPSTFAAFAGVAPLSPASGEPTAAVPVAAAARVHPCSPVVRPLAVVVVSMGVIVHTRTASVKQKARGWPRCRFL